MSDITDYDFRTNSSLGINKDALSMLDEEVRVLVGVNGQKKNDVNTTPAFRVVSYMFSIPGWKPTKVDRSSKGGCPLYLYENIHEQSSVEE